ncbi:unnamed protein product, partial [Oppiella nova]
YSGATAGAHRLWSHRSYRAALPLRLILTLCNTICYQNSAHEWARDHRTHHKHTDTDADLHNSRRGFFFSHCGWLMCQKHPDVVREGRTIDMADLLADLLVAFQHRHYTPMVIVLCFITPTVVPWYLWNESLWNAYFVCAMLRWTASLNAIWCVNSMAHRFGSRPYDVGIEPRDNLLTTIFSFGEGWHNFHHAFPWDYRTSEWGWNVSGTTLVLDMCATIGWVTIAGVSASRWLPPVRPGLDPRPTSIE